MEVIGLFSKSAAVAHLKVCADERLPARVVEVAFHEEVEQVSCITADGAEFGVTALQDLITERCTHIRTPLEKRAWELETHNIQKKKLL